MLGNIVYEKIPMGMKKGKAEVKKEKDNARIHIMKKTMIQLATEIITGKK